MPAITFAVDDRALFAKLDRALPAVEDAIEAALKPLAKSMAAEAQALALAHIRTEGKNPGQYVASIHGGAFRKSGRVGGYVRSGSPLAHLLEEGTAERFRKVLPTVADVAGRAGYTGAMPPFPALAPAFAGAESAVRAAIESAARTVNPEGAP